MSFASVIRKTGLTADRYDCANELAGKAFKKIAREERDHEEQLESLNAKILRANAAYEKHVRSLAGNATAKRGRLSLDAHEATAAHERHINAVSGPTRDISLAKANHGVLMAARRDGIARDAALTVTALAESEWRRACEVTKRAGAEIGNVVGFANFCAQHMPSTVPEPLEPTPRLQRAPPSQSSQTSPTSPESPAASFANVAPKQPSYAAPDVASSPDPGRRGGPRPLPVPNGNQYSPPKPAPPPAASARPPSQPYQRSEPAEATAVMRRELQRNDWSQPEKVPRRSASPPELLSPSPRSSKIMASVATLDAVASAAARRATPVTTPALSHGGAGSDSSGGFVASPTASEAGPDPMVLTRHLMNDDRTPKAHPPRYGGDGHELGKGRPLPNGFVYEDHEEETLAQLPTKRGAAMARTMSIESTESSRSFVARMKVRTVWTCICSCKMTMSTGTVCRGASGERGIAPSSGASPPGAWVALGLTIGTVLSANAAR